jgi:cytochrome c peroxidase
MEIKPGLRLPEAKFAYMTSEGPKLADLADLSRGRRIVIFALPGAFTSTCETAHVPSFIRTADAIRAKGISAICCIASNDIFVMQRWGEITGAHAAGIMMLSDPNGAFASALGLAFDVPHEAMFRRSRRYSMLIEDGVVKIYNPEIKRGCEISGGENMLAQL